MASFYTRQMNFRPLWIAITTAVLATFSVFLPTAGAQVAQADSTMTLLVGGDVQWSLYLRPPTVLFTTPDPKDEDWRAVPYLNQGASKAAWQSLQASSEKSESKHKSIEYGLHFGSERESVDYPLKKLAPLFHTADLVFLNLETPLSDTAQMAGLSRTPEAFAGALSRAGVGLVNIANNHTDDAQTQGFFDTMRSLSAADLPFVGGGKNLADARKPVILERQDVRIGFLGYSQFSNMGEPAFASEGRAGIAPMDPVAMADDIRKLRASVDVVAVSIHWGEDKSARVSPANRQLAHQLIDAGADIILGSHTPFPKGIEVYRNKTIIYSPSHVAIAHNYTDWGDNVLIRLSVARTGVRRIEVLPIAGKGTELAQPYLLQGAEARSLLEQVQTRSAALDTHLDIAGDEGIIRIP